MTVSTTARHFELAPDDRNFAQTRLEKSFRFARDLTEIHLVVTAESHRYVAEATLRLRHRDLALREEAMDPRQVIDLIADRIDRQLRRLHDKRVDHQRAIRPNGHAEPSTPADDGAIEDGSET